MSPNFLLALSRLSEHEGGYANNPRDPGGETMFGVTSVTARKWGYTGAMRFLPKETANAIFYKEYWLPIRGDDLPLPLSFQLFDMSVNSGPVQTTKTLQTILGVPVDGNFGPITFNAVSGRGIPDLPSRFILARHGYLRKLPTWPVFGRGWSERMVKNALFLLEDTLAARDSA